MIGAFYQPKAVITDVDTLQTLPDRELSAGLAEMIKHGLIADSEHADWLGKNMAALRAKQPNVLADAIAHSCGIKAHVVAQDEKEQGLRAILNFGHTFGHAIEHLQGYGSWLHGEAVGAGMVVAAYCSMQLGNITATEYQAMVDLIASAGLPTKLPAQSPIAFFEAMQIDKKNDAGKIRYVMLKQRGQAYVTALDDALVEAALRYHQ
jgi:3-dehydroquinate synthetase